jgi:hypothetical protein
VSSACLILILIVLSESVCVLDVVKGSEGEMESSEESQLCMFRMGLENTGKVGVTSHIYFELMHTSLDIRGFCIVPVEDDGLLLWICVFIKEKQGCVCMRVW